MRPGARPAKRSTRVGGLLREILAARGGEEGLAELADDLSFEVDDLLPLVDAAVRRRPLFRGAPFTLPGHEEDPPS